MGTEETTSPAPRGASFRNTKLFRKGLLLDGLLVGGYFLLFIIPAMFAGCDSCTFAQHLLASVGLGVRYGVGVLAVLLVYFWFISIPVLGCLLATPLIAGLILDYKGSGQDAG
jgi:hypothetical protein